MDDASPVEVGQCAGDVRSDAAGIIDGASELSRIRPIAGAPVRGRKVLQILVFYDQSEQARIERDELGDTRLPVLVS